MSAVVHVGEKVHLVMRRRFESDVRRHFIGEVTAYDRGNARLEGYAYVFDARSNQFVRRDERRVKIVNLGDSGYVANVFSAEVDLSALRYTQSARGNLVVTDDNGFELDIHEFGAHR
ncbi:MAG: hypothetical protein R3233_01255 [Xanthomonadales bacterium]|nr:hypothetical protein [Xanthomonadales bacterium]